MRKNKSKYVSSDKSEISHRPLWGTSEILTLMDRLSNICDKTVMLILEW